METIERVYRQRILGKEAVAPLVQVAKTGSDQLAQKDFLAPLGCTRVRD